MLHLLRQASTSSNASMNFLKSSTNVSMFALKGDCLADGVDRGKAERGMEIDKYAQITSLKLHLNILRDVTGVITKLIVKILSVSPGTK